MTKLIEDFSVEQWAQVDAAAEKWLSIGASTARCDREKVEESMTWLYENVLSLPKPEFKWYESPLQASKAVGEDLSGDFVFSPAWFSWTIHRIVVSEIINDFGEADPELIRNFTQLMEHVGLAAAFEGLCVCTERPIKLMLDDNGDQHCETGPAVEYADGWKHYYWHGISIPADWIEKKDTLDVSVALTHENIERRRCAAEILGWDRVLSVLNPKVLDKNPDPMIGTLLQADLPNAPGSKFLKVLCGTGRTFVYPVPQEVQSAQAAQDAIWEVGEGEYAPEART